MEDGNHLAERETFEERWRRRFRGFAEASEDDAGIAGWSPLGLRARLDNFRDLIGTRSISGLWADVGCGAGTYSRDLAGRGCEVVGFDYSFETILKARSRSATAAGPYWTVTDATRLPVGGAAFDGALCFGVLQALSSSQQVIRELARVVKPGGEIWVDALNGWCVPHAGERLLRWLSGRPPHVRYESPRRLLHLARENGLQEVRLHWVLIMPSRFSGIQWMARKRAVQWLLRLLPGVAALVSHAVVVRGVVPRR